MTDNGGEVDPRARRLKWFVERQEALDDQAADINALKRELRAEIKDADFDPKAFRRLIERRREEPSAVIEADATLEEYEILLGCGAAAAGVLRAERTADGTFAVTMAKGPAAVKLTGKAKTLRDAEILAAFNVGSGDPAP